MTVLFADLVGSTARAEQLDPEDVRALLSAYHDSCAGARAVRRHGGEVHRRRRDGAVRRAGRARGRPRAGRARGARDPGHDGRVDERSGAELDVRIGINTGEALVSLGARRRAGEGMVAGDVVNTAARLQSAAPVNGILVDEQTYPAPTRVIDYREDEPVEAKGKAEPVTVWEASSRARASASTCASRRRAPRRPRARARPARRALARVRAEREPQLVTLVGVPGIGKSRLVYELFADVDARPELICWRQGRSLPYGDGVAFWALGEMVKAQAGILETDSAARRRRSSPRGRGVVGDGEASWVERHLRPLVGLARRGDASAGGARGVRRLAALLRGARRAAARSCSSSRISTGPTTACSTSSTSSSTG